MENVMLFPIVGILAQNNILLIAQHVVFEQSIYCANVPFREYLVPIILHLQQVLLPKINFRR